MAEKIDFNIERWAIIGASRGLGFEFAKVAKAQYPGIELFLASRSLNQFDVSKEDLFEINAETIAQFNPHRVFYFSGGGTYGSFHKYEWKDHKWTMNVNFLFPSFLILYLQKFKGRIKQVVLTGSKIAEQSADPNAAMYCAAKHALKGLVDSISEEDSPIKITLFSPGYMDTQLLPKNASPKQQDLAVHPQYFAGQLLQLVKDSSCK